MNAQHARIKGQGSRVKVKNQGSRVKGQGVGSVRPDIRSDIRYQTSDIRHQTSDIRSQNCHLSIGDESIWKGDCCERNVYQ